MLIKIIDNDKSSQVQQNTPQLKLYFGNQINFDNDLKIFYPFLSDLEIIRSKRFVKKEDERTYVISHALLNKKISVLLEKDFNRLNIQYFEKKKPYIESSPSDFNLSHSSGYFAFAISNTISIGVDIEVIKDKFNFKPIVKQYFHKNEIAYILNSNLSSLVQGKRFYEIWTRKESFLKMLGLGLSEELSEIDLSPGDKKKTISDKNNIINASFSETFISTLNLSTNLVLSLSTNCPVIISLDECKVF